MVTRSVPWRRLSSARHPDHPLLGPPPLGGCLPRKVTGAAGTSGRSTMDSEAGIEAVVRAFEDGTLSRAGRMHREHRVGLDRTGGHPRAWRAGRDIMTIERVVETYHEA